MNIEQKLLNQPTFYVKGSIFHPGVTRINKIRGAKTFLAVLALSTVLGQYNNFIKLEPSLFKIYSKSQTNPYVHLSWSIGRVISTPAAILALIKLNPSQIYSVITIAFAVCHLINIVNTGSYGLFCCSYALTGGVASGSIEVLPVYLVWRYFSPKKKPYVTGMYLLVSYLAHKYCWFELFGRKVVEAVEDKTKDE